MAKFVANFVRSLSSRVLVRMRTRRANTTFRLKQWSCSTRPS